MNDLRYASRQLRKAPLFSVVAIATLAIGVGATTAIFSAVNATLLRPLPYPHPEQLIDVHTRLLDGRVTTGLLSSVELGALAESTSVVERVAGLSNQTFEATLMREDGAPENVLMSGVTEGFFETLGLPLVRGRTFTHQEHLIAGQNAPLALIVSNRAWTRLFGRDPSIVGKPVRFGEVQATATIVGIAPASMDFPVGADFWFNLRSNPQDVAHVFQTVLRLRPGASIDGLRAAAAVRMAALARTIPSDVGREYVIRPLLTALVGDLAPMLLIVFGAAALLLVLACVNVTNLSLARSMTRLREMTVRSALGASRGRIARQLVTESMVLATAGAIVGMALGLTGLRLMLLRGASKLPRLDAVPFDGRVFAFACGILLFTGLTTTIAPMLRLTRTDLRTLLNEQGRSTTAGRATSRFMSAMVTVEIALAVALIAGSGWLVQGFVRLRSVDAGFDPRGRLVVDVRTIRSFSTPDAALLWPSELVSHVRSVAGRAEVGAAATIPFRADRDGALNIEFADEAPDPNHAKGAHTRLVSPGFFEAMGMNVVAGRSFTADDRRGAQPVALVNRAFVRRYLPTADPLRASFAYGYPTVDRKTMTRIVGVVRDARYVSLAQEAEPTFYVPAEQLPFPFLRTSVVVAPADRRPEALVSSIRAEVTRFDPQSVIAFTTLQAVVEETLGRQQLGMVVMLIFGMTALLLAAIGVYGVIADGVARREGEIATRAALGASRRQVLALIFGGALSWIIAGVVVGLAGAYAGGRLVSSSVFEMRATDPIVLFGAAAVAAAIGAIATIIPAIVASRIDPVRSLRAE